ncbi:MAG: cell division protein ZapA [Flavobacteriales bacterium]|jgi:cell division protein ZapA (FtsZ GTPase activity inhibitor)|nr:cell division protein ZapA [Flavobacteriales bacterium]
MEKLNIKISLANRLYPMNIASSEEKTIRLSAFKIEKMLKVLKDKYSVKDDQDLLAMCALQLCVKLEKSDVHRKEIEEKIIDSIFDINEKISDLV